MAAIAAVGSYTNVTQVVSAAASTQILAQIDVLRGLIDIATGTAPGPQAHNGFDRIHPQLATQLMAECDALKAAISAAPTA